jgi:SAM-dependent methyltransferase
MLLNRLLLNPEVRAVWGTTDGAALLAAYERVWQRKTILRQIYEKWYQEISTELRPGTIVEIGAGTGNFKRWLQARGRSCCTVDILPGRFVNVQADALCLPFRSTSMDNVVMIDALHHFARPSAFLAEATRILRPGGRLLLVEPYVSWWGAFVYRYLHHERVDFHFDENHPTTKEAWDGNAAIPQLVLAERNRNRLPLRVRQMRYRELLAYPLSGGFSYRSLLPGPVLLALHQLEQCRLLQNQFVSLRVFAVLERPRDDVSPTTID